MSAFEDKHLSARELLYQEVSDLSWICHWAWSPRKIHAGCYPLQQSVALVLGDSWFDRTKPLRQSVRTHTNRHSHHQPLVTRMHGPYRLDIG